MNYKEITDKLKAVAGAHINVVSTDAGYLENLNWGEGKYPLVMFVSQPSTFDQNKQNFNFTMVVGDIMDENKLQQTEKQSNMHQIGMEILLRLIEDSYHEPYQLPEDNITFTFFIDDLPDLCAGCQFDFTITVPFKNVDCYLPFKS
jgi:hypothetical protein